MFTSVCSGESFRRVFFVADLPRFQIQLPNAGFASLAATFVVLAEGSVVFGLDDRRPIPADLATGATSHLDVSPPEEDSHEGVSEYGTEGTVQNKVDSRVQKYEAVGDLPYAFCHVVLLHVAFPEKSGHDGVRGQAEDEDEDHGDEHESDSVPRAQLLALHSLPPQDVDDFGVDEDEDEDRNDAPEQVLNPGVRDHELLVPAQLGHHHVLAGDVVVDVHDGLQAVPEDRGYGKEADDDEDGGDHGPGLGDGAERLGAGRVADGDVTIHCHCHRQPGCDTDSNLGTNNNISY